MTLQQHNYNLECNYSISRDASLYVEVQRGLILFTSINMAYINNMALKLQQIFECI